jgi:hypothetical protein
MRIILHLWAMEMRREGLIQAKQNNTDMLSVDVTRVPA